MNIKTILLFCFIAISVAIADDTEKNTENEGKNLSVSFINRYSLHYMIAI